MAEYTMKIALGAKQADGTNPILFDGLPSCFNLKDAERTRFEVTYGSMGQKGGTIAPHEMLDYPFRVDGCWFKITGLSGVAGVFSTEQVKELIRQHGADCYGKDIVLEA